MKDGVLIIDKPAGLTSHDVVARVRHTLKERRVGHTGTLDPFATGVLVILIGRATRLAQFLNVDEKEYQGVIRFGYATDTGDVTGERLETHLSQNAIDKIVHSLERGEIDLAFESLKGEIEQVPPMYSAKKIQGKRLYQMARSGVEVERAAVRVKIYELEVIAREGKPIRSLNDGIHELSLRVVCSAGTYIRALAETIGERLGMPAHLASLRRTRAGAFRIADAIGLDELKAKTEGGDIELSILSPDAALSGMPFVHLTADEARMALHGVAVPVKAGGDKNWRDDEAIRLRDADNRLIAVGFFDTTTRSLRPRVVLSPEK